MELVGLRRERLKKLLSPMDLAKQSGVSANTIRSIEAGSHPVRLSTARRLVEALGVSIAELQRPDGDGESKGRAA